MYKAFKLFVDMDKAGMDLYVQMHVGVNKLRASMQVSLTLFTIYIPLFSNNKYPVNFKISLNVVVMINILSGQYCSNIVVIIEVFLLLHITCNIQTTYSII